MKVFTDDGNDDNDDDGDDDDVVVGKVCSELSRYFARDHNSKLELFLREQHG